MILMLWENVEKKYGKKLASKMKKHIGMVTVVVRKNGKLDIPESDILLAYRIVKKEKVSPLEWD